MKGVLRVRNLSAPFRDEGGTGRRQEQGEDSLSALHPSPGQRTTGKRETTPSSWMLSAGSSGSTDTCDPHQTQQRLGVSAPLSELRSRPTLFFYPN